jgi:hypothetical protein
MLSSLKKLDNERFNIWEREPVINLKQVSPSSLVEIYVKHVPEIGLVVIPFNYIKIEDKEINNITSYEHITANKEYVDEYNQLGIFSLLYYLYRKEWKNEVTIHLIEDISKVELLEIMDDIDIFGDYFSIKLCLCPVKHHKLLAGEVDNINEKEIDVGLRLLL